MGVAGVAAKTSFLCFCLCEMCVRVKLFSLLIIEYGIFGESTVFSLLIGQNMRPFPENTVLY